jgi:hypothetical protein
MSAIPQNTNLILVDTRIISKTFILPSVQANPGRILVIKDYYGASRNSTITITTQGSDLIDDYNTSYAFSNAYGTLTFISDGFASWRMTGFYNGALSFASATNPVYLIPAGTTAVLTYVSPLACQFTITFGANTVRCDYYVSITPTITADANPVSGLTLSSGIISSFGNFVINATYYVIVIPYDAGGLAGPQIVSPGKVCVNFPSPPINLGLSINGTTGLASVSFTAGLNATSYSWTMYKGTTNDYTTGTVFSTGTSASNSFTTQIDGSGYFYYTVYSINLVGTSSQVVSNPAVSTYFSQVNTYTYTGGDQYFTAPTGVTSVTVHLWGAAGGGAGQPPPAYGGAGAYVSGTLAVTPGSTYIVITGQAGIYNDAGGPGAYGGGGGAPQQYANESNGGGGGRSAIRNVANTADLVDAGGGGGGGGGYTEIYGGGAATWVGTAYSGQGPYGGQGGSQGGGGSSGGQGLIGALGNNSGSLYQGSRSNNEYCGAGGGGYYGGGGGGADNPRGKGPPGTASGGGGGSSYTGGISNATGANSPNGYYTAPGQNITYYQTGVAQGTFTTGGNGLVIIVVGSPPPLAPKNLTFTVSNGIGTLAWSTYIGGASGFTWTLYQNTTTQYTGTIYSSGSTASTTTTISVPTGYYYYVTVTATVSGVTSLFVTSSISISETQLSINSSTGVATLSWYDKTSTTFWTLYRGTTNDYTTGKVFASGSSVSSATVNTYAPGYYYFVSYALVNGVASGVLISPLTLSTYVYFTGSSVSGISLWLDAADTTTMTLSGTSVQTWRDKSSSFLTATAGGTAPVYTTYNSFPAMQFSGSNSFTTGTIPSANLDSTGITFFAAVTQTNNSQASAAVLATQTPEKSLRYDAGYSLYTINNTTLRGFQNDFVSGVKCFIDTAASFNAYDNGSNVYVTTTAVTYQAQTTSTFFQLGIWGTSYFFGFLNEAIVFNNAISIATRQQVEGYLAWKWGFTSSLIATHPYKTTPPPFTINIQQAPLGLSITSVNPTTARLSWTAYSGASSYTWILYQKSTSVFSGVTYSTGSTSAITITTSVISGNYYYFSLTATTNNGTTAYATSSSLLF